MTVDNSQPPAGAGTVTNDGRTAPGTEADGSAAKTVEQLQAELEAERAKNAEAERVKAAQAEQITAMKPKVEAFNQSQRTAAVGPTSPPTTGTPQDQLDQQWALLQQAAQTQQAIMQRYPADSFEHESAKAALANIAASAHYIGVQMQQRDATRRLDEAKPAFLALPEKYRAKAWEFFVQGLAANVESALLMAKGQIAPDDLEDQQKKLAEERERMDREKKALAEGITPAGARPVLMPKLEPITDGKIKVPRSKWMQLDSLPPKEKAEYLAKYRRGEVEVVPD